MIVYTKQEITIPLAFTFADNADASSEIPLWEYKDGFRQFAIDFPAGWVAANLGVEVKRLVPDAAWIPLLAPSTVNYAAITNIPATACRKIFPAEGWAVGNGAALIRFRSLTPGTDVAVAQTGGPLTLYFIPLS